MKPVAPAMVKEETLPLSLVFILLFYSGTILAPQVLFPALRELYPQTIFSGVAIILYTHYLLAGKIIFEFELVQKIYLAYCIIATIGLYRSAEVGFLAPGLEDVSNAWKHFVFLVILISLSRSLSLISFAFTWICVTVALFVLHSIKALAMGASGADNRFDNYVGMISNADYIGIFLMIFVVVYFHLALETQKGFMRLAWFALSIFSLIITVKTETRTALLILVFLAPYWILITSFSMTEIFRKGTILLLFAVILIFICSLSNFKDSSFVKRMSTITKYGSDDVDFSTKSRTFMWQQGIALWLANPLLGVGSSATTPYLNLTLEGVKLQDRAGKEEGFSMHNTFIQILAERGITGLILFGWMVQKAYRNFNMVARYSRGKAEKKKLVLLATIGRLFFVGYIIGSMFTTIEYDWTFYAFVALSVSSARYIHESVSVVETEAKRAIPPYKGVLKSAQ